ncbi:MAG TPA: Hsp20/alpha crystallin family protein [Acidisoma sp.]|uniref:Hsp20/alpha crystallin family protein n=1 Tax=Acidisoma sp. TaxID=1872115 RepID=UPI002CC3D82F|nr:Hsp20/alpha crystallin family protein [Acidisoma sp.]HTI00501.1 Hsp20/alpha crystallin family protein [Acidisoma sp.]
MSQTIAPAAQTAMPATLDGAVTARVAFEALQAEIDLICDSFGPRPTALPLIRNLLDFDLGVPAALLTARPVAADFLRTEEGYEITVELPGLDENDVEIAVGAGILTIRADRQDSSGAAQPDHYYLSERRFGQVLRSFRLPQAADPARLTVSCRRGVLHIRIPRQEVQQ